MIRRLKSVRLRLTLAYVAVLAVLLAAYSAGVVFVMREWFEQDLDRRLRRDLDAARDILDPAPGGGLEWDPDDDDAEKPFDADVRIQAFAAGGQELPGSPWKGSPETADLEPVRVADGGATLVLEDGRWVRARTLATTVSGVPVRLRAARSMESVRRRIGKLTTVMSWAYPAALVIAGVAGWLLARRAFRPVAAMAARARTITADRLYERLPVEDPHDELGRLATVFNETIARLDRSFDQLRRFTADASHELRTPLMALRATGEMGLREPRDEAGHREILGSMLEECDRLTRLVDMLLALARADGGTMAPARVACALPELVREIADQLAVLAEEKRVRVEVDAGGPVAVAADPALLRVAIRNLLDNAIEYSPPGGRVRIAVRGGGDGGAAIAVSDDGPGIPPEHQAHVFERFYRVDKARTRRAGGFGLGLSLAAQAVAAHGGRIDLDSAPGRGSTFTIVLPAEAAES